MPDANFLESLKRAPWVLLNIDEVEFDIRIELMRRVYGDDANVGVLRSCLLRASGNLGKAISVGSYIRPDILGSSKKIVFVRPRTDGK